MIEHHFHFSTAWPSGRNSAGTIHCGRLTTQVSIDTGMGGPGIGNQPVEMLHFDSTGAKPDWIQRLGLKPVYRRRADQLQPASRHN